MDNAEIAEKAVVQAAIDFVQNARGLHENYNIHVEGDFFRTVEDFIEKRKKEAAKEAMFSKLDHVIALLEDLQTLADDAGYYDIKSTTGVALRDFRGPQLHNGE